VREAVIFLEMNELASYYFAVARIVADDCTIRDVLDKDLLPGTIRNEMA
jgi:hypothetical protein